MKLYLVGLLGSGKSVLGKKIAEVMELPFIDLDEAIEFREGKKVSEIFSEKGQEHFRQVEADVLRKQSAAEKFVMATGGGTPCFHDSMTFMNETGVTIFLNTPLSQIIKRMDNAQKKSRPLLANVGEEQLESKLNELLQARLPFYGLAQHSINGATATAQDVLQLISKK
jgi:shikimate kinase